MKKSEQASKEKRSVATHGGAREGAGRKPEGQAAKVTLSVRISERSRAYLERLAMEEKSNISVELEKIVQKEMRNDVH